MLALISVWNNLTLDGTSANIRRLQCPLSMRLWLDQVLGETELEKQSICTEGCPHATQTVLLLH